MEISGEARWAPPHAGHSDVRTRSGRGRHPSAVLVLSSANGPVPPAAVSETPEILAPAADAPGGPLVPQLA
ncbi:hypothetical protein J8F10_23080 [Gemmata sp. G18]|uniref:Uncharacterized protein n=1 Tax=Gemmata palustris TaxID=2822762 RepID=A0ABS5BWU6_9BACT|nr:hypothetical protein [Gemmata palustris]MBP3958143.1 hypothetical protein [Gemmata palustris]